ncbi:MAG TPA: metal ABC transporter permease [Candidatus Hydrogenedentes bacterium]|nr:metal ABC transporter permease [Candidatus Hydrogenedentota bacterium]HIJ72494.1 metal ABC transporter permease [Candidatus Hydrogenedentota bacterium]
MTETPRFLMVQTSLLAVVLVLHTYVGLHIVRRSLIFSDLVLDQAAALGALVGIYFGIQYGGVGSYVVALVAVVAGSAMLALLKPRNPLVPREAVIGILYALALVASLLVGDKLAGGEAYVAKTLAGSLLWVSWPLVYVTTAVYAALLMVHWVFRRKFLALSDGTQDLTNEKLWDFLFFVTQGIITVLIVPVAGVLLAYAFLMIPAATAALFRKDWLGAVVLGWGVGLAACLTGLGASYHFDWPYGPTLVVALGVVFLAAVVCRAIVPRRAQP